MSSSVCFARNKLHFGQPRQQRGYAILAWVLMAVSLIGLLGSAMLRGTDLGQSVAANQFVHALQAQAALIRARLLACSTDYPAGHNGTLYRPNFPAAATATPASNLVCPGSGVNLWNGPDTVGLPPVLSGMGAWVYVNDASSLRLETTANTAERAALLLDVAKGLGSRASVNAQTLTWILASTP